MSTPFPIQIAEPAGFENQMDFRLYASRATEMLNNLIANPAVRSSSYANVALQCLVTNFEQEQLDLLDNCIALAQSSAMSPPMPIYPGARVFPNSPFADWVDPAYWQAYANSFQLLADRRLTGDPRIGIDAENYDTSSEPTLTTLSSNGFTVQQFREGIQPFLDKMVAVGAIVCVYPQVRATTEADLNQFIVALLDTLRPQHVQIWWEDTFGVSEDKRLTPITDFPRKVAAMRRSEADFERNYGVRGLKHRHVIDDDVIRAWGAPMRSDLNTYGAIRPWIFDYTRIDHSQNGTQAFVAGTTVKKISDAQSVNDTRYVWAFPPLNRSSLNSVGLATPLLLEPWRGNASQIQRTNAIGADAEGMRIQPPPGFTVGEMRADALMTGGKTWMIDFTFQIPSSVASDVPVISQAQYNLGLWQVYYDNTNNRLVLQIRKPLNAPDAPGSIVPVPDPPGRRYVAFAALPGVPRDSDIRIQIGRNGNTWLYAVQSGAHQYEAENLATNSFSGGATIITSSICSGGKKVNLAMSEWVQFNGVRADSNTDFELTIAYINSGDTTVDVSVNGGAPISVALPNSKNAVGVVTVEDIDLVLGTSNTIRVTNASAATIALDRVFLLAVAFNRIPNVGFDAATHRLLVVGAGQTPATFPTDNTQACCVGLLLKGQLAVWHRLPSDIEITSQIRAGQYPWARGS